MQTHRQSITSPPPQVFHYSLDWRFLIPMSEPARTCLLFEENDGFQQTLEQVGLGAARFSLSELRARQDRSFQVLILPFGPPVAWVGAARPDRVQFFVSLRRFIDPGGSLLVGFENLLSLRAGSRGGYRASTPRRMAGELKDAGFRSVRVYGAMPDLQIPEYIFDLAPGAVAFALRNRFRRKPTLLRSLHLLARVSGWEALSNFLPCYFAVAAA